jgi:hypothetical protein
MIEEAKRGEEVKAATDWCFICLEDLREGERISTSCCRVLMHD